MGRQHLPALDGIRGIAILLVIAFHCRVVYSSLDEISYPIFRLLDMGWCGVDLFFVLSGFLITGILLDSRTSPAYFRTFYSRRVLRIFPLYFAYVGVMLLVNPPAANPLWYFSFLLNWKSDHGYNDLYLGHMWSLAIEEQFYMLWPLVIWLCPRRWLKWICVGLAITGLIVRVWMNAAGAAPEAMYRLTPSRMDGLALGALTAILMRSDGAWRKWLPWVWRSAAALLVVAVARSAAIYWNDPLTRTVIPSLLAIVFAGCVYAAATWRDGPLQRILRNPLLRQIGKYSYAMYVLQSITYGLTCEWVKQSLAGESLALRMVLKALYFPALVGLVFTMAWASWNVLEKPFLKLKRFFPYAAGDALLEPAAVLLVHDEAVKDSQDLLPVHVNAL